MFQVQVPPPVAFKSLPSLLSGPRFHLPTTGRSSSNSP